MPESITNPFHHVDSSRSIHAGCQHQQEPNTMSQTIERVRILGISGSLRKVSFSTALLTILAQRAAPAVDLQVVTLDDIPFYNEDLDIAPGIPAVNALKQAVAASDAVLFSTPEYNHGIPGVLKNALDWLSRPVFNSCFKDKPVSIITSSLAFTGGVRAQYQLRETLISMQAHIVPGPEVVIGNVHHKFSQGIYNDEAGLDFMLKSVARLSESALSRRGILV
jgi:chromate reductase